jgi:hypothetical protein
MAFASFRKQLWRPTIKSSSLHFLFSLATVIMIIFKCRFTGDEMCSDAFKPYPVKDDDGNIVEGLMQIDSIKVNKVC